MLKYLFITITQDATKAAVLEKYSHAAISDDSVSTV
jgi:hypothetical protein